MPLKIKPNYLESYIIINQNQSKDRLGHKENKKFSDSTKIPLALIPHVRFTFLKLEDQLLIG